MISASHGSREVSIHAPYIGSDEPRMVLIGEPCSVSIHAPYIGSDASYMCKEDAIGVSIHAPYIGSD